MRIAKFVLLPTCFLAASAKDQSPRPDYKRAWEIVNGPEGYESFVAELR